MIKGIIFDLDGTLIDSIPYHFRAFEALLNEYGIKIPRKKIKKLMGLSTLDILRKLDKIKKSGLRLADLREERHYYYFKAMGEKNIEFKDAIPTIKKLKKMGYRVAIATGSSNTIYFHSTSKKLRMQFKNVITIDDVAKGKPFPDCFFLAAAEMDLRPDECLIVGDSEFDMDGAKSAGMEFAGVLTGAGTKKAFGKDAIRSLSEIFRRL